MVVPRGDGFRGSWVKGVAGCFPVLATLLYIHNLSRRKFVYKHSRGWGQNAVVKQGREVLSPGSQGKVSWGRWERANIRSWREELTT